MFPPSLNLALNLALKSPSSPPLWCGLVFGAGIGFYASWHIFDRIFLIILGTAASALLVAFTCGRWGDSAWSCLIQFLFW